MPLIDDWQRLATNDPAIIKQWQDFFGSRIAFWGVPCGPDNDILVLDVDVKENNGFEYIKNNQLQIPDTFTQDTLSGGRHYIFKYPKDGSEYGQKVGLFGKKAKSGLDVRGARGWIAWYGKNLNNKQILEAPTWLIDAVKKNEPVEPTVNGTLLNLSEPVAKAMLDASLELIRNAPENEGNAVLNTESFKVGQMVACGAFDRKFAENILFQAARERVNSKGERRPEYECKATIESGLDGGIKNPMVSPFTGPPEAKIPISAPMPAVAERWTPSRLTRFDLLNVSKLKKPQLFEHWSTEDIQITTADGGTGKTTLKLYEAICLALGDRFLGFECMQRGRTLFITGEDTDKKLAAMLGAIMRQMGLFEPLPGNDEKVQCVLDSIIIKKDADLCLIAKDKQGFLYPNQIAMNRIMEAVTDFQPKMIVFDPISSFWGSESMLNDMNKAVTRFVSDLVDRSNACVEIVNHMGKSSSAQKDMTQFAGRGGSGLPSNSRVSRVLRGLTPEEFTDMTSKELEADQTAILCNINKFSDGSPLFNKPFVIVREGYLFKRLQLTNQKVRELEQKQTNVERVFAFIKEELEGGRWPTAAVVIEHFKNNGVPIPKTATEAAITMLQYQGHMGDKVRLIPNPDLSIGGKALTLIDSENREYDFSKH